MPRSVISAVLIVFAGIPSTFSGCTKPPTNAAHLFPPVTKIRNVHAKYSDLKSTMEYDFDVPAEKLPRIIEVLQSADVDPHPGSWVLFGDLEIMLDDGNQFRVDLFYRQTQNAWAFTTGTNKHQTFNVGEPLHQLFDALQQAREAASPPTTDAND